MKSTLTLEELALYARQSAERFRQRGQRRSAAAILEFAEAVIAEKTRPAESAPSAETATGESYGERIGLCGCIETENRNG